ncbi:hypothetical protein V5799_022984 [Amblyomma americanum]|uniref:Uncharacterized protein n=1 Tax=Amblyomma americanum TaxID=6943 RepID=A0AAQ4FJ21_AMBAM
MWPSDDFVVFTEWDKLRKNPLEQRPKYWSLAKKRFLSSLRAVSCEWRPPSGEPLPNVKLHRIIWEKDMHQKPRSAPTTVVRARRVNRRTTRRTKRLKLPERDTVKEDEEEYSYANEGPAAGRECGSVTADLRHACAPPHDAPSLPATLLPA